METLTGPRALELLREVAAGPAPLQPGLSYTRDGQPCCIVGHVLARHGVPSSTIAALDTAGSLGGSLPIRTVANIPMSEVAREILDIAQDVQDDGGSWPDALAEVDKRARIRGLTT